MSDNNTTMPLDTNDLNGAAAEASTPNADTTAPTADTAMPGVDNGVSGANTEVPGAQPDPVAPQQFAAPAPAKNSVLGNYNLMSVIAFVSGLLGLFMGFPAIAGIVCGHIAVSQIKTSQEEGRTFAIAGLVLGYVVLVLTILLILALVAAIILVEVSYNGHAALSPVNVMGDLALLTV